MAGIAIVIATFSKGIGLLTSAYNLKPSLPIDGIRLYDMIVTDEEALEKNLTLSFEFSLYLMEHPEFASKIPDRSRIVLLPGDDPELARTNQEIADKAKRFDDEPDRPVVFVTFDRLLPARSRIERPRLTTPP